MLVRYTGTSDFRELGAADFKKFGVEGGRKTTFAQDEATEVDDSLWPALEKIGDFEQVDETKPAAEEVQSNLSVEEVSIDSAAEAPIKSSKR